MRCLLVEVISCPWKKEVGIYRKKEWGNLIIMWVGKTPRLVVPECLHLSGNDHAGLHISITLLHINYVVMHLSTFKPCYKIGSTLASDLSYISIGLNIYTPAELLQDILSVKAFLSMASHHCNFRTLNLASGWKFLSSKTLCQIKKSLPIPAPVSDKKSLPVPVSANSTCPSESSFL